MRRAKRRSSRALVAILVLAIGAGTLAAYKKFKGHPATGNGLVAIEKQAIRQQATGLLGSKPLLSTSQTPTASPPKDNVAPPAPPHQDLRQNEPFKVESPKPEAPVIKPQPIASTSANPLLDGRARFDAGDLIGARNLVTQAVAGATLNPADASAARELANKISDDLLFGRKVAKDDPHCFAYTVQLGDRLSKLAVQNEVTPELLCRINGIADARKMRAHQTLKIVRGPFHAVVSKSQFTMDIYLGIPGEAGSVLVRSFSVGLGKDDSTPAGKWLIEPHKKLKNPTYYSPRGEGIIASDDPRNPLGEYWLGLVGLEGQAVGKASYGIHGTIDPNSIGKMESMGCIRMRNEDVAIVYELLVDGKSTVLVRE